MSEVVRPAPDPARDARVAKRRADDARRAGRALDALLAPRLGPPCTCVQASDMGHPPDCPRADWARGNRKCPRGSLGHPWPCGRIECQVGDGE